LEKLSVKNIPYRNFVCHFAFCGFHCLLGHLGNVDDKTLRDRKRRTEENRLVLFYECTPYIGIPDFDSRHRLAPDVKKSKVTPKIDKHKKRV
jgi:hypothetical protein